MAFSVWHLCGGLGALAGFLIGPTFHRAADHNGEFVQQPDFINYISNF